MTRLFAAALIAALIAPVAPLDAQSPERALTVFVTAAPGAKVDNESRKQHDAAYAEADSKRKELEKTLKAQHGNKRESWPAEAQERYFNVEEAAWLANVRRLYGRENQEQLPDSVEDTKRGLTGAGLRSNKNNVILVETPDAAHLIVELRGRRSDSGSGGLLGRQYYVFFVIKPGPKLSANRFAAIPRKHKQGTMEWNFEAFGQGSWKLAGTMVSTIVDQFIEKHYDVLTKISDAR